MLKSCWGYTWTWAYIVVFLTSENETISGFYTRFRTHPYRQNQKFFGNEYSGPIFWQYLRIMNPHRNISQLFDSFTLAHRAPENLIPLCNFPSFAVRRRPLTCLTFLTHFCRRLPPVYTELSSPLNCRSPTISPFFKSFYCRAALSGGSPCCIVSSEMDTFGGSEPQYAEAVIPAELWNQVGEVLSV